MALLECEDAAVLNRNGETELIHGVRSVLSFSSGSSKDARFDRVQSRA